jgi:uncharacterized protein (DUF2147 family)
MWLFCLIPALALAQAPMPSGGASGGYNTIDSNGTAQTQRQIVNYISGANATITCTDNAGSTRTDCTVSATAGASTVSFPPNPKNSTYQTVAADFNNFKYISVASGTFTITLVASGSQPAGGTGIWVFNYGTGVVTIARSGQNINGAAANYTLGPGAGTLILSDGTNYFAQSMELASAADGVCTPTVSSNAATFTDTGACSIFTYTLNGSDGNITSGSLATFATGKIYAFQITADPPYTFTWPATVTAPPAIVMDSAAITYFPCYYNGSTCNPIAGTSVGYSQGPVASAPTNNPAAGYYKMWIDNTASKNRMMGMDSAGTVTGFVKDIAAVSHNFLTSIAAGIPSQAQPATGDISGLGSIATLNQGTMTNGDYCTYSTSSTQIICNSAGAGGGSPTFPPNPQTSTYSTVAGDFSAFKTINVASGTFNITLLGTAPTAGQGIFIVNFGSGVVTVVRNGLTINGASANLTIAAGSASAPNGMFIVSDGSNYFAQPLIGSTGGGGMTYPSGSGIAIVSSGTSWGTTLTAPSGTVVGTTDTMTLTNKLIQPRVTTVSSGSSMAVNSNNSDIVYMDSSVAAGTLTISADTGSPANGQKLIIKVRACDGASAGQQTYSWTTGAGGYYSGSDITLPAVTYCSVANTPYTDYIGFIYDGVSSHWQIVALARGY